MEELLVTLVNFSWGLPMVLLLVGGGAYFVVHSRLLPYRKLSHAISIISGKFDNEKNAKGDLSHFQALIVALSGTLGLGNIAGVAVAITMGGPGAIFWMWLTAIFGIATKFYTASLAIMYRGEDRSGKLQGGPMYVIREGLGKKYLPLAWLFCIGCIFGALPLFQINQLVQILREVIAVPFGLTAADNHFTFDLVVGIGLFLLIAWIVMGKLTRITAVATKVVPLMVVGYFIMTLTLLAMNYEKIPETFLLILASAFNPSSAAGGLLGTVIIIGVQRGAFSNEAGIGTESLAHGAAKTTEPIREGFVASFGPIVDTLIVCTCTALAVLVTGAWQTDFQGVGMAVYAFETTFPNLGSYLLMVMVFFLSVSTVLSFWYYGSKCSEFLFGPSFERFYKLFYLLLIIAGAIGSLSVVINFITFMYALMAIPTMISTLLLSSKVRIAAKKYLRDHL
ncbi:alanine:cation symporter family protein [Colwellia sp. D2M02]|uniref:alanine/glycine:cation symporter family protein n=1 Tax=Colwellia sp. D2M02 TaxID=2841562 RepID=UPI001C0A0C4D|nr:alanine/glycine:cation symporter family protein [Colwellia sp. D2M02]MBU2893527.1 alanine:cation symporter family protein [Colwellia sp. D2M02]